MASPFAVFRRNQRVLLAVSGITAMVAFVFLDPIFKMLGGSHAPDNPLVVRTNYGNYKRSDLEAIEQQRHLVEIFLQRVIAARVQKEFEGRGMPPDRLQMAIKYTYESIHRQLMARATPPGDAAAIETLILARRAEEMGMVASDQAINDLLRLFAGSVYGQLRDIIAGLSRGGNSMPISQTYLFDGLRRELLASRYTEMFRLSTLGMPPAERWEYFEQLNLKAEARVLPVKAEQFLSAAQPSDEDLEKFFERHQNQLPEPNSPEPGFKEPAKMAFQYFQANLETFTEKATGQVTSEEMHEYYEKNKAVQFRELGLPPGKDEQPPAKTGEMEDPLGPDEPAADKPPAGKDSPPASEKPADGQSQPDKTTPDKAAPEKPKSSQLNPDRGAGVFRLASALQTADKPGSDAADAKAAPADAKASDDAPGDAKPAEPAADGAAQAPADAADADKKPEPKYEPFEKVEDTIHRQLAREKAEKTLEETFEKLGAKMRAYASARSVYVANKEDDPALKEPEPLDFNALADEYGIEHKETTLISAYQAQTQTDLGKSMSNFINDPRVGFRQLTFVQLAYGDPKLFRPERTFDDENNRYLWWATKSTTEQVPAFEDVRSKVLQAYKMREARKLALTQAEKYAKTARETNKPLDEIFANREGMEVTDTGAFSRMTMGNTPYDFESSEPRLSAVHGVEAPGQEFMQAVFSSKVGDVKVAQNEPQDIAYVIQVERFLPDRNLLEHEFLLEPVQKYARLMDLDQHNLYLSWVRTLEQDAGVDWVEPPRTDARGELD